LTISGSTAVATALALAALATAGCGLGPGKGLGDVELSATRDYGSEFVLAPASEGVSEADTVMRVLERSADISTLYVDGVESTVGAADYPVRGGERIWWDYRDWGGAMRVPAVVGSWPQPFAGGYEGGKGLPASVVCMGDAGQEACRTARERLEAAGVRLATGSGGDGVRLLVGPWRAIREDPAAAQIERGPQTSGVFAEIEAGRGGCRIEGLDQDGRPARGFGPGAGLVAATRHYEAAPTWVVTGCGEAGVEAAAGLLDAADLRDRYAVVAEGGVPTPLPVR
jgi:hypothetical protein